jgi:hypothetical protein
VANTGAPAVPFVGPWTSTRLALPTSGEASAQGTSPLSAPMPVSAATGAEARMPLEKSMAAERTADESTPAAANTFDAPNAAEQPATSSAIRVATQSTHALLTIRDVQLGTAESSRVAAAIAHELARQGYTSITTYVNGVARRYVADPFTPADPRAVEAPLPKEQG